MDNKKLTVLTECEREVWLLFEQGLTQKQIAKRLGITSSAVAAHIRRAERRFREYEQYCAAEERNLEPVSFPVTRGEVKIIIKALFEYEHHLESSAARRVGSNWIERLSYEAKIVADLYDRAQSVIWGKVDQRLPANWDEET